MKKLILFLTFTTSILLVNAQVPVYRWASKVAGLGNDYGDIIKTDALGNVYIAGRFDGTCDFDPGASVSNKMSAGSSDAFIAKYTSSGALTWVISMGSTGADRVYAIDVDANGNVYVTGNFSLTVDFDPGPGLLNFTSIGGLDIFMAKYNSNGNLVWANSIGNTNTEISESIALDASGNFYVGGEFSSPNLDLDAGANTLTVNNGNTTVTYDPFLVKYDTAGNFVWGFNLQGLSSDYIKSVCVDANDNVLVGGYFNSTMNVDPIGGTSLTSLGSADCFIARYSSIGNYDWSTKFGGTLLDNIFSITTANNNIYATGTYNSVVDFNPGIDTFNIQSKGSTDVFIVSFTNAGTFNWVGSIGGNGADNSNYIIANSAGDVFVAGSFIDSANFDRSNANVYVKTYAGRDGFIVKYDNNGNYRWDQKIGSQGTDYVRSLEFDPNDGEILSTGYWTTGTLFLDPSNFSNSLSLTGANDLFIAKYGECEYPVIATQPAITGTCVGGNVQFNIAASGQNISIVWQEGTNGGINWSNITDGGVYSGSTTSTLTLSGVGAPFNNLFYRCIISSSCGLSTTSGVGILLVGTVDTSVSVNSHIMVAAQTAATYQWLDCNNNYAPIPGATAKQFIPTVPGTYALSVTKNGCNDTSACYTILTIGVDDLIANEDVRIFPVPANQELTIEMNSDGNYTASIFDLTGRKLLSENYTFNRIARIPVSSLESGAYLVGIRKNDGSPSFFRIVVE
ncbi:MAG: T9SS type A sorting domain-containing protein [Bacteroidetes bacterium]|nr:T9SS type A sorting domain-containing protein [Bacteroidota bacterium]